MYQVIYESRNRFDHPLVTIRMFQCLSSVKEPFQYQSAQRHKLSGAYQYNSQY